MIAFRDRKARELGLDLLVHTNPDGLARGINPIDHGSAVHTDIMKTQALRQALDAHRLRRPRSAAPRRDEEAKPRQGAGVLVPHGGAPLGSEEPAPEI